MTGALRGLRAALVAAALAVAGGSGLAAAPAAAAQKTLPRGMTEVRAVEGITEYRLANGLQLLLVPDASKPTTTVNLTIRVGSRHENYGETGMAHLLEHLLFKGSPRHPNVWAEFDKRGLRANGSTWYDRTNYFATFSANDDNLRWMVGWLADAMVNSHVAKRDLDAEMTVVRNEMERGENRPDSILMQRLLATMYEWHAYGKDTIGARSDVENVDIGRLRAFYKTWYQPDNATLVVSGAFDRAKTLALVQATFGALPKPARALPRLYTLDPAQDGERSVTVRRVGGAPLVFAGWHMPDGAHPDFAAAELLAAILGDAPSGRLHKRLTEAGLAASTFGWTKALADPGFLLAGAQLAPGQAVAAAQEALLKTAEGFAAEPVTDVEVRRAKVRWLKSWEEQFANPERVGTALSEFIAQGDWRLYFALRDRVQAATQADVQRVATERLLGANRTLGVYLPTEQPQRAPVPAQVTAEESLRTFKPRAGADAVEAFEPTPANIDARTERGALPVGLRYALLPKATRGDTVRATLVLRYGDVGALAGQAEAAGALAALLDKGTAELSREQVQDRLDELRSSLSFGAGADRLQVAITSRRAHLPATIALVGELLRAPALRADAFDEHRRQARAAIEEQRHEPEAQAALVVDRHLNPYPRGDIRHVRDFDERAADVDALTLDAVRAFHRRFYGASHAIFSAVGDFDAGAIKQALAAAFGEWASPSAYTRVPFPHVAVPPLARSLATPDKQNATFEARLALPISDNDADYPALMLANTLLGGGGNSRLWKRIREQEGLSYDVGAGIDWGTLDVNSTWQASAIFAPVNRAKVEAAFRAEVERALKEGFTEAEFSEARRGLLNRRRLTRAQDAALAAGWAANLEVGRTFRRTAEVDAALARLTLGEVNAALRKYIAPQQMAIVFAGDFK